MMATEINLISFNDRLLFFFLVLKCSITSMTTAKSITSLLQCHNVTNLRCDVTLPQSKFKPSCKHWMYCSGTCEFKHLISLFTNPRTIRSFFADFS